MALFPTRRTRSFYARALYSRGQYTTRAGGFKGRFHMRDSGDYEHLAGPMFEREQLETFLQVLKEDDVLYEIGGHIGTWSVFMAQRLSKGKLVVFEPEPRNNARLAENLSLNQLNNVTLLKVAASNSNGTASFGVHDRNSDGRHSLIVNEVHGQTIEVPTLRLADGTQAHTIPTPTPLAIACAGAQLPVLEEAWRSLQRQTYQRIFIEAHGVQLKQIGKTVDDVAAVLKDAGFTPVTQWDRGGEVISIMQRD